MQRREFITLLGGTVATWPFRARAQQAATLPRIACPGPARATQAAEVYQAFSSQLEKNGFREGQNIIVDHRAIQDPRGPFVGAAELVRAKPDLLVAAGPEVALQAVIGASGYIPIVMFAINFDPIERGYVTCLAQSTGNITGVIVRHLDLDQQTIVLMMQ